MSHDPSDDNWGGARGADIRGNILYVYDPDGPREQHYINTAEGATHEGRLFLHDEVCTGDRLTYTIKHVNILLTKDENPAKIKERIVELLPHLSDKQKNWVAEGISLDALEVVRSINHDTAATIELNQQNRAETPGTVLERSSPTITR